MPYAELNLYMGLCGSSGCTEGMFDRDLKKDSYHQNRFNSAMTTVREELDLAVNFSLSKDYWYYPSMEYGYSGFVKDEKQAVKLIRFAEKNIPKSGAVIELIKCMHGKIKFFRKLRIEDIVEQDKNRLIAKLKKSKMKFGYDEGTPYSKKPHLGMSEEKIWDEALKFYK